MQHISLNDLPQPKLSAKEKSLFTAVRKNDSERVRQLIEERVNVNCRMTPKRSFEFNLAPLHEAAFRQNIEIVKLLLDAEADVNAESGHMQSIGHPGETPLNWACGFRTAGTLPNVELVKLLLDRGANPNHRMTDLRASVFEASIYKGRIDIIKLQLENGALVNPDATGPDSPLMIAADRGDFEIATELLKRGAEVNSSASGKTALMKAAERGAVDVVELLLQHRANVNLRDKRGQTAIMFAATKCGELYVPFENETKYFPVVKQLVAAGADLNVVDISGMTALDWAERNPHKDRPDFAQNFFEKCALFLAGLGAPRNKPK